ncbi:MAG: GEVED domain-containing protein, partial [Bacteroidota bacterium]|nr:GEVED domain-containing protein [Bacteroidota bacterium]
MKKILPSLLSIITIAVLLFANNNLYSQCASNGNLDWNTGVTRVIFNTIDNTDLNNPKDVGYEDFTAQSTDVSIGNSYNLTVNVETDGDYTVHSIVWIDWNNNNDFTDAGEEYDMVSATNVSNGATSASPYNITIPAGASIGSTIMRVSAKYNADPTSCETSFDGEVHDYTINILAPPLFPTFYNTSDNNASVYFNNIRTATMPVFALSSTNTGGYDAYYLEINTKDDFSGTSYTQTILGTYTSGIKYDIYCDNLAPALPTTEGVVYYVRAKASDDSGATWGSWSSQNWTFTYNSTSTDYGWHQTAETQFTEGTFTGNYIDYSTNGNNTDYIFSGIGSFDMRAGTDDGCKEGTGWYPSVNFMTIGYQDENIGNGTPADIHNGTRFTNVPIPNNADIISATYSLDDNDGCPTFDAAIVDIDLTAYDTDNAPVLSTTLDTYTKTTNVVDWSMDFTSGGTHSISGVDNVVEEVISRAGWNENNALTILCDDDATEYDNGCVSQADNGSSTAPRLQGTFTDFVNTIQSPAIKFADFQCASNYEELRWDDDETYGDIKIHLYYDNSGTPTIIPDGALAGNSTGFDANIVDISGLNTTTYATLYIVADIRYTSTSTGQSPELNSWSITTTPTPSVTASTDQSICSGGSADLSVASGCGYYTWSTGETGTDITVTPVSTTTYYVTATTSDGSTATDQVTVTIAPLNAGTIGSDQNVCDGDTPSGLTDETSAFGGIGTVNYQWQEQADCTGGWSNISGETSATLSFSSAIAQTTCYRREATDDCGNKYSNIITVTIDPLPTASAGGNETICSNESATVSGASADYGDISWTHDGAGSLSGTTTLTPIYTTASGDEGSTVTLTMTVTSNNCGTATATYSVTVDPQPTASAGGSETICSNGNATVSGATASNGSITWTHDGNGILSDATTLTPTYNADPADEGSTVTLTMTVTSTNTCAPQTATATYS